MNFLVWIWRIRLTIRMSVGSNFVLSEPQNLLPGQGHRKNKFECDLTKSGESKCKPRYFNELSSAHDSESKALIFFGQGGSDLGLGRSDGTSHHLRPEALILFHQASLSQTSRAIWTLVHDLLAIYLIQDYFGPSYCWKNNFKGLSIPRLLWAFSLRPQQRDCTQNHQLIRNCLDFVDT